MEKVDKETKEILTRHVQELIKETFGFDKIENIEKDYKGITQDMVDAIIGRAFFERRAAVLAGIGKTLSLFVTTVVFAMPAGPVHPVTWIDQLGLPPGRCLPLCFSGQPFALPLAVQICSEPGKSASR